MASNIGKLTVLLSSKRNSVYAGQISQFISKSLLNNAASVDGPLKQTPGGYILVEDVHVSPSDATPHFTVDAYDEPKLTEDIAKPIGVIHVYENGELTTYIEPRKKAWDAYLARVATKDAAAKAGTS